MGSFRGRERPAVQAAAAGLADWDGVIVDDDRPPLPRRRALQDRRSDPARFSPSDPPAPDRRSPRSVTAIRQDIDGMTGPTLALRRFIYGTRQGMFSKSWSAWGDAARKERLCVMAELRTRTGAEGRRKCLRRLETAVVHLN